jgi:hypothetical protein
VPKVDVNRLCSAFSVHHSHAIIGPMDGASTPGDDPTAGEQFTSAASDRCPSCQTPLASDQRYCINCGERRGKARFTAAAGAPLPEPKSAPKQPRQGGRGNGAATLVGFIAVLLLAMGVGVLIGHDSSGNKNTNTKEASTPVQIVTVGGGGTGSGTSASTNGSKSKRSKGKSSKSSSHTHVSKSTANAAATAATKAYGGGGSKISDPTVQVGQKASGPGTQNGKFTGNFFP